jgi:hypothetical protein
MTDQLDLAFAAIRKLDPARQEEIAVILQMLAAGDDGDLTPEDEMAIAISEAESARGEYASDEEIAAIWAKHGL